MPSTLAQEWVRAYQPDVQARNFAGNEVALLPHPRLRVGLPYECQSKVDGIVLPVAGQDFGGDLVRSILVEVSG